MTDLHVDLNTYEIYLGTGYFCNIPQSCGLTAYIPAQGSVLCFLGRIDGVVFRVWGVAACTIPEAYKVRG